MRKIWLGPATALVAFAVRGSAVVSQKNVSQLDHERFEGDGDYRHGRHLQQTDDGDDETQQEERTCLTIFQDILLLLETIDEREPIRVPTPPAPPAITGSIVQGETFTQSLSSIVAAGGSVDLNTATPIIAETTISIPGQGTFSVGTSDALLVFVPLADFLGVATILYTVTVNGATSEPASIEITVAAAATTTIVATPATMPSDAPQSLPTALPQSMPTEAPQLQPQPTILPQSLPTEAPQSLQPTTMPTDVSQSQPPTTPADTPQSQSTKPTALPSKAPQSQPTTVPPTEEPKSQPSELPTEAPQTQSTKPTALPTKAPQTVPTLPPQSQPTAAPTDCPNGSLSYFPGEFTGQTTQNGVILSQGLQSRRLTTSGDRIEFDTGEQSSLRMHPLADGAAVIPKLNVALEETADYYLCSNAESSSNGGVGCLEFNAQHQLVGYERLLTGTRRNCGGGRSPWNTWLSAEEDESSGRVWEVDPNWRVTGSTVSSWQTNCVDEGGNFESVAYWHTNDEYHFYITEDASNGALVRFIPNRAASVIDGEDIQNRLTGGGGYSFLEYIGVTNARPGDSGTFRWTTSRRTGESSATNYPYTEGIDVKGDTLFFISKTQQELHTLDLIAMTYTVSSTNSGSSDEFQGQPDQIAKIFGDKASGGRDIVYFCEDASDGDVHAVDETGNYYTILQGENYGCETTGLTFSPDNTMMYVTFQCRSAILQIWREDGCAFGTDPVLDIKYHSD